MFIQSKRVQEYFVVTGKIIFLPLISHIMRGRFKCQIFAYDKATCLLICLTVSSRNDLSIAPCFIGGFSFHMQGNND